MFKSKRLFTVFLVGIGLVMIWLMGSPSGFDLKATINRLNTFPPIAWTLCGVGVVLFLWGVWSLTRKKSLEKPGWGLLRLAGGMAFVALAAPVLVRPFLEEDITNEGRVRALSDADLTAAEAPQNTTDWPQWLGPMRDGHSQETGLNVDWKAKRPPELWRKPLGGGYSSIVHVAGKLYTMDRHGGSERIVCLDSKTGDVLWTHDYPADYSGMRAGYTEGPRATPSIHNNRLYAIGATGIFHCLALPEPGQKPKVLWRHDLLAMFNAPLPQWGVACSPLIEGEMVVVHPGGKDGSVAAFDPVSGELKWKALSDRPGYSSPVAATFGGVRQIVSFTGENLVGLRATDGKLLWSYSWLTNYDCNAATPLIIGKCVFISSGYNKGCALLEIQGEGPDAQSVGVLFLRLGKLMRNHHSNCILHDSHLFGSDNTNGLWRCFNLRTFEEKWRTAGPGKGCAICAEGHLIILSQQGELALVEATPEKYLEKGRFEVFEEGRTWAFPMLCQGRLYLRSNSEILCLDLRK